MTRTLAAAVLAALLLPGCMFHVEHRIPVDATFGRAVAADAERTEFRNTRVKRYLLGGTLPWALSYRGSRKLVEPAPGRRIEALEITTRFSPLDALMRFVPYLSYVLSQRTVEVRGVYVDPPASSVVPVSVPRHEARRGELEAVEREGR